MSQIFNIVAPVFLLVGFGYAASALKFISDEGTDALLKFVTLFAVTCLLFRATATIDIANSLKADLLAAYYFPAFTCFFIGILVARKVFGNRPGEAVAAGFTTLFANSLFIGIPVAQRAYGEEADPAIFAIISIHAATMYALGVICMEVSARDGAGALAAMKKVTHSLSKNPLVIAVVLGFGYNFTTLPIPSAVDDALALMAGIALPAGMFAVGAALTRYALADNIREAGVMVAFKTMLHPALAMVLAFYVFSLTEVEARTVTLMAAAPGGLNIYLFAVLYDRNKELAANAMLLGTLISILTLPLWLWILSQ
jgi:predicted permease